MLKSRSTVKEVTTQKRELVLILYNGLYSEICTDEGLNIEIDESDSSITIKFTFDNIFCITEEQLCLNGLFLLAETNHIYFEGQKIVLSLWFRFWNPSFVDVPQYINNKSKI